VADDAVAELRLEPGRFRRHDRIGIGDRHQLIDRRRIHRESDRVVAAVDQTLQLRNYAFYNLKTSSHEPSGWTVGDGYGFEFANVQLPHDFIFGSGSVPSQVGDIAFVKAIYFAPNGDSGKGQNAADDTVEVYFCRPDSSGMPRPANRAGIAMSKEDATI